MTIFTVSQTTGFSFVANNITDTVAPGVTISDTGNDAVFSDKGLSHLVNYGALLADAGSFTGVHFTGDNGSIFNDASGIIAGFEGIFLEGNSISVVNNGSIDGIDSCIFIDAGSNDQILNHGYIHGGGAGIFTGVVGTDVYNTGVVDSEGAGIGVNTGTGLPANIVNTGIVHGTTFAIDAINGAFVLTNEGALIGDVTSTATAADDTIINSGMIKGAINLASGTDTITNSGKITGDVHFGPGNDTFIGTGGTSGAIFAGGGNDRIIGGNGGVSIHVGGGNDTLSGGPGPDQFIFDSALAGQFERITNFKHGIDKIVLSEADFAKLGPHGTLGPAHFQVGPAVTPSQHIIYTPGNGFLYYDSNGSAPGGMTHFATLAAHLNLHSTDFVVIA